MVLTLLVVDLALAEAGQLRLEVKAFSLADVIARASEGLDVQAHEREVSLKFEVTSGLPNLQADEQRITQVLFNLMSNALRHTPTGGTVNISAELRDGRVRVGVRDAEIGVPPRIFRTSLSASIAPRRWLDAGFFQPAVFRWSGRLAGEQPPSGC